MSSTKCTCNIILLNQVTVTELPTVTVAVRQSSHALQKCGVVQHLMPDYGQLENVAETMETPSLCSDDTLSQFGLHPLKKVKVK